jgi:hypothetical protein
VGGRIGAASETAYRDRARLCGMLYSRWRYSAAWRDEEILKFSIDSLQVCASPCYICHVLLTLCLSHSYLNRPTHNFPGFNVGDSGFASPLRADLCPSFPTPPINRPFSIQSFESYLLVASGFESVDETLVSCGPGLLRALGEFFILICH